MIPSPNGLDTIARSPVKNAALGLQVPQLVEACWWSKDQTGLPPAPLVGFCLSLTPGVSAVSNPGVHWLVVDVLAAAAAFLFLSFRSTGDFFLNPKTLNLCRFSISFQDLLLEFMFEVGI